MARDPKSCGNPLCFNEGSLWCGSCKSVRYCSKECQKEHWKIHRQSFFHKKPDMPDIFKEYSKCYPTHAPGSMAVKIATASVRDMVDSNVKNLFKEDFSVESLAKRWNEVSKELISFVSGATPGDIYTNKVFIPYDTKSKPQQFRNTPPIQPAVLTNGTNVIDIGFVDFGIAIDAVSTIKHGEEPVTVYAFEKEPMCVAKCLVMLEMMKVTEVSPRSVLEVWMSTLWSKDTLSAFTTAVRSLLQAEMALQPQVRRVLEFWQGAPRVSQDAALKFWLLKHLDKMPVAVMHACNLTSERDRVALLRYELTGALYEDSSTTVGSLVMCNENSSIGINQGCDSCIEALPTFVHLHRRSESILDRVRGYFCEQISLFASHLCEGSLVFHPRVADLSVHNIALLAEMHALNPYVVSWSNVSDYMYPADFHSMARRISGPDTVHYLHSCNWTTCVYGVDVYDINEHARGFFFNAGMEICSQSQKSLVFAAVPVSHYRNFCQVPLTRKFIKHYLRYFFKGQEDVHVATCNGLTPISMPNPCLRSNEAAHLIMCYGSAVNFGANSYDYMNDDD